MHRPLSRHCKADKRTKYLTNNKKPPVCVPAAGCVPYQLQLKHLLDFRNRGYPAQSLYFL